MMELKTGVVIAINAIRAYFVGHDVIVMPTGDGGANVIVEGVPLGAPYSQETTWIGFLLSNACPDDDTYPFYVTGELSRIDGVALSAPLHSGNQFPPTAAPDEARAAVMVSRRQRNQSSFSHETPLRKLLTVLQWMLAQ
ncbi:hypothetical protein [Rhizobium johnstonii]|uniref:hypothetical protein n=1 Tax=Rhizobium johnstonii TaxID=3019933 RepID=UPI002DDD39DD|nr:hypothetical protein U8P72_11960 [Rhizobium johnstonii]